MVCVLILYFDRLLSAVVLSFVSCRQILPLILMFVMFGPVVLTGLIFAFDYVATSDWGIKVGLSDDPRTRLTKFYKKHNPTKMRDVRRGASDIPTAAVCTVVVVVCRVEALRVAVVLLCCRTLNDTVIL